MCDELVKRLRDAAKISDALAVLLPHSEGNAMAKLYNEAADAIVEMSKRVQPVVLCRDCTYCRKGKASLECEKHTYAWNNPNRWVNEDDFCSWGVKREGKRCMTNW